MSNIEKLTNKSRKLLLKLEEECKNEVREKSLELGEAYSNAVGDGYHDETVALMERERLDAQSRLYNVTQLLKTSEEQDLPTQFETVQLGHKVRVNLIDDSLVPETAEVTLLTSGNLRVLSDEFDMENDIIASNESPLGKALIGARVNETVTYNGSFRATIEEIGVAKKVFLEE